METDIIQFFFFSILLHDVVVCLPWSLYSFFFVYGGRANLSPILPSAHAVLKTKSRHTVHARIETVALAPCPIQPARVRVVHDRFERRYMPLPALRASRRPPKFETLVVRRDPLQRAQYAATREADMLQGAQPRSCPREALTAEEATEQCRVASFGLTGCKK